MVVTFEISYSWWARPLFLVLGMGPRWSSVEVSPTELRVRMGWAFRAVIPRSAVGSATRYHGLVLGWGVHGWRGRWLVNGSARGIVSIEIDPPTPARVLGVPIGLRRLDVSVDEPDGLIAALR